MSYSFGVRAANKVDALDQIGSKLKEIIEKDPDHTHRVDEEAIKTAASAAVHVLADDPDKEVEVTLIGSVRSSIDGTYTTSIDLNIRANLIAKQTPQ